METISCLEIQPVSLSPFPITFGSLCGISPASFYTTPPLLLPMCFPTAKILVHYRILSQISVAQPIFPSNSTETLAHNGFRSNNGYHP